MSDVLQARLDNLGRAQLAAAGFTDATIRKAYGALDRALEAKRIKVLQHKGTLLESKPYEDHEVQVRAAELVTKLADHHPAKLGIELDGALKVTTDEELLGILASLGPAAGGA